MELPLDRAAAVARFQQRVDGGVCGPGAVGEPVAGRPGRSGRLLRRGRFRLGLRRLGDQDAQAPAVLCDGSLGGLAQVVPEVPPVRDLDSLRCPGGGAFGEERGTVAADDLDTGPLCQPCGQSRCLPVGQQIDGAPRLDVDEDRAVVAALAGGVLVDADDPGRGHFRLGKCIDQAKDGAPADGHPEDGGQAGAGPARQGKPHCGQG